MVRGLNSSSESELGWLGEFAKGATRIPVRRELCKLITGRPSDFRRRLLSLLSFKFREFGSVMALSIIGAADEGVKRLEGASSTRDIGPPELSILLSPFDIKRLDAYANNILDYHVILDLVPSLAHLFFEKRLGPSVHLSAVQSAILLAVGLQRKQIEEVEGELGVPVSQVLALFVKVVRKVVKRMQEVQREGVSEKNGEVEGAKEASGAVRSVNGEADDATPRADERDVEMAAEVAEKDPEEESEERQVFREKQREMIQALDLSK